MQAYPASSEIRLQPLEKYSFKIPISLLGKDIQFFIKTISAFVAYVQSHSHVEIQNDGHFGCEAPI